MSFRLPSTVWPVVNRDHVVGNVHTFGAETRPCLTSVAAERARKPRQEQAAASKDTFLRGEVRHIQEQLEMKTSEVDSLQKELGREKRNTKEV